MTGEWPDPDETVTLRPSGDTVTVDRVDRRHTFPVFIRDTELGVIRPVRRTMLEEYSSPRSEE